ncbi:hypothetical protein [Candidatus Uabimicrobium amorphum]|uniref:Uncharacterized protein n=1 Tax=Uabimicrobium amorphum TaxID=2596890 RepID=A0A5S9IMT4_UABAM|nr:hypothetical protein [Candidatus Uabimicrobium amorphum]BBM84411.1 hypothetical protein UABAM_02770 [Candidatus Uabimicrobium amorphum]
MRNLFIVLLCCGFVFGDYAVEKTFHGFYNKPRNMQFEVVVPKPRVVKSAEDLKSFQGLIVANKISKTSPAKPSDDRLLSKASVDFTKHMLLVMFNDEAMAGKAVVKSIKVKDKSMVVNYGFAAEFVIGSYPTDVAKYTAVLVSRFDGEVRFVLEEKKETSLKSNIFRKKLDLQYITVKPCSYLEHPPQVGHENPDITVEVGATFDVINDMGSYLHVVFYDGKEGYMVNDSKCWHKLTTIYGKIVEIPFRESQESIDLGKEKMTFMLEAVQEKKATAKVGYTFHESALKMLDKISKMAGNRVMIRGFVEGGDAVLGVVRIYGIWKMKNTRNAVDK